MPTLGLPRPFFQNLAAANSFFSTPASLISNITYEPDSLDSHQNLLFPLLQYRRLTRRFPTHITLISHAFKQRRFTEIHRAAIHWPLERFSFLGLDPPKEVTDPDELRAGEEERGWGLWCRDWYGAGEQLSAKKKARDPWGVQGEEGVEGLVKRERWGVLETGVVELVTWKNEQLFEGQTPWIWEEENDEAGNAG
ncbi:MAG: hypothetical protein M1837_000133 [Sclerophora amabilis]|nr:MAG: hypothetical protein M1837_000133 [Sclerophora amabilis]